MAKYSPIAPVHILRQLADKGELGNYLLLLAHDVNAHPRRYASLIGDLRDTHSDYGQEVFIIMDNGTVENGAPVTKEELIQAAIIVEANCVVSPDIIGDLEGTKKLVTEQVPYLREYFPVMFIPQGQNHLQLCEFIRWAMGKYRPEYWGVPRWVATKLGSRAYLTNYINIKYSEHESFKPKIHLLGMSEFIEDDIGCLYINNVMGIDSANPLVYGQAGFEMSIEDYSHLDRGNFWEQAVLNAHAVNNVRWMHATAAKAP